MMEDYVKISIGEVERKKCPHCGQVYEYPPPQGEPYYCEHCGLLEDDEE